MRQPTHRVAGVLAVTMIPVFLAGDAAAARETAGGIAQRLLLVTIATWFVLIAMRLGSKARQTAGAARKGEGELAEISFCRVIVAIVFAVI